MPAQLERGRKPAPTVTLWIEIRSTTERGIALYQGAKHEHVDGRTGEIVEREHWHWMAKSQVTVLQQRRDNGRTIAEVEIPEWLARREGLI